MPNKRIDFPSGGGAIISNTHYARWVVTKYGYALTLMEMVSGRARKVTRLVKTRNAALKAARKWMKS